MSITGAGRGLIIMTELNERESKFVAAYLNNGQNCTEAYLQVSPNVKRETARIEGSRLKRSPKVSRYLAEHNTALVKAGEEQSAITKGYLVNTTRRIIDKAESNEELATALKGIEVGAKLTGAFTQEEDDESKYMTFLQKVTIKQMTVNIGENTKDCGINDTLGHNSPPYPNTIEAEYTEDTNEAG